MIRFTILVIAFVFAANRLEAQASSCRPADAASQRLVNSLRTLAGSTATGRVQLRNALGLQAVPAAEIVLVTDKKICDKVVSGMNTRLGTRNLVRQLYVVKVGSDYAAQDPGNPAGEWIPTVTFDGKQFRFKGVVLSL